MHNQLKGQPPPEGEPSGQAPPPGSLPAFLADLPEASNAAGFLAEISKVLASLRSHETLARLARLLVPTLADFCILDVFDEEGEIQRVEAVHKDPVRQELMHELQRFHPPRIGAPAGVGRVLRTGEPIFAPEVTEDDLQASATDGAHLRLLLTLGPRSAILVPMISGGRVLGSITLAYTDSGRRYGRADLALAEELGYRTALAIENARLYEKERETGQRLEAMAEELRRRVAELAAADRRKDEFLATLAHELRNPLAALATAAQALQERPEAERAAELGAVVGRQVRHLTRLVDDLLDISRVNRGRIEMRKEPLEIRQVVTRALDTARPFLDQKRHRLAVTLPDEPLWIEADATRVEQVLANLLHNAAKFTEPEGRVTLTVAREGGEVALAVGDNGAGIAAELLPHIFDLFFQGDRSLVRSHGGLGIGLTLVRTLVERHGGRVEAKSEGPGRGSEITVRLPLRPPPEPAAAAAPAFLTVQPAGPASRVLVVEDNVDAAEALAALLRLWGHEVTLAHDGPAALEAARCRQPEVVLLDIGLPGMDGYAVARALRAQAELAGALLVALTGYGQEADRDLSRLAGFDHHVVKPVDAAELRQLLARQPV